MDLQNIQNIFLFYSKFSQSSLQLLQVVEKSFPFITNICIDNKKTREKIINSQIKVQKVPFLIIIYQNDSVQLNEGQEAFNFINTMIESTISPQPPQQQPIPQPPPMQMPMQPPVQMPIQPPVPQQDLNFNMVSSQPNRYLTDIETGSQVSDMVDKPKQIIEPSQTTQPAQQKDDLRFNMIEPLNKNTQNKEGVEQNNYMASENKTQMTEDDGKKINVRNILDNIPRS